MHKGLQRLLAVLLLSAIAASPLQAQQYSKITYVHSDADGTPFAATDEQGNIEWQIDHYPYGAEYSNTEVARKNNISFAGKPYDEEIGLSYFGARWYDPDIGRFTGIDPMPVNPNDYRTFNRYNYGFNNPYKYVDPDGRLPVLIPVAIWVAKALTVTGVGVSSYTVGSNGYAVYSGRKSVGEASKDAAIGVGSGLLLKGAGAGVLKLGSGASKFVINENKAQKIFGDRAGHLQDTASNRKLLENVANDKKTTLGTDRFGNQWSAKNQKDGSQIWTQTRNGEITNGGVNQTQKTFNNQTGLSAKERPNFKKKKKKK